MKESEQRWKIAKQSVVRAIPKENASNLENDFRCKMLDRDIKG